MAKNKRNPRTVLKLFDLEQLKAAVLNSLTSRGSQRSYDHAIREFIDRYCSEPRLALNKVAVTRYRSASDRRNMRLPPSTCAWRPFAGLPTKLPTAGFWAPILQPEIQRV